MIMSYSQSKKISKKSWSEISKISKEFDKNNLRRGENYGGTRPYR